MEENLQDGGGVDSTPQILFGVKEKFNGLIVFFDDIMKIFHGNPPQILFGDKEKFNGLIVFFDDIIKIFYGNLR